MENTEKAKPDKSPAKSGNENFKMTIRVIFFVLLFETLEIWLRKAVALGIFIWVVGLSLFLMGVVKDKQILLRRGPWILAWTVTVAVLTFAADRFGWF